MSLAAPDLNQDGMPDLSFGNNDAPMKGYVRSASSERSLVVHLEGPATNPTAVGAKVSVNGDQHAEVRAGCGYLSQSPPALYFYLAAGDSPVAIDVRWPDGSQDSFAEARPASGVLVLRKP